MNPSKMAKNSITRLPIMLVFFLVAFIYLGTLIPFSQNIIAFQKQELDPPPVKDHHQPLLEEALRKAKMADSETVIITIINKAYVEPINDENPSMLDLFLEGFWEGEGTRQLLDHLLVVAMDSAAYDRCVFRRLHCYGLSTDGGVDFSGEKLFLSKEFIDMMWRRTLFLLDVLKLGYNFIFTDTDIIWLRNPFTRLSSNTSEDLQISTDIFTGDPWSTSNPINTGFYYVRSNPKTIALFQTWYDSRNNYPSNMKEQDILALMKRAGVFKQMGLLVRYLDVTYFSGFCTDSEDVTVVVTVHANCCKGIAAKVVDLKHVLRDWKNYRNDRHIIASPNYNNNSNNNNNNHFRWSEHYYCNHSWGPSKNTLV
ncbi:unnamed protein product [Cuscuta europaea]|uniref:Nucleotide-diphospho-sugar transferase domain-containing protein n=1 Tax=Cuscuta europaea TaxID=41803 RepID=A0A9P0ZAQ5_CUSEU|nr:unnamed protein product [Cuscuta europaea]